MQRCIMRGQLLDISRAARECPRLGFASLQQTAQLRAAAWSVHRWMLKDMVILRWVDKNIAACGNVPNIESRCTW